MWTSRAPEARTREVEVGVGVVWWLGCDEDGGDEEEVEDEDGCEPFSLSSGGCLLRIAWRGCVGVFVLGHVDRMS